MLAPATCGHKNHSTVLKDFYKKLKKMAAIIMEEEDLFNALKEFYVVSQVRSMNKLLLAKSTRVYSFAVM